jgi:hypothetical protein
MNISHYSEHVMKYKQRVIYTPVHYIICTVLFLNSSQCDFWFSELCHSVVGETYHFHLQGELDAICSSKTLVTTIKTTAEDHNSHCQL